MAPATKGPPGRRSDPEAPTGLTVQVPCSHPTWQPVPETGALSSAWCLQLAPLPGAPSWTRGALAEDCGWMFIVSCHLMRAGFTILVLLEGPRRLWSPRLRLAHPAPTSCGISRAWEQHPLPNAGARGGAGARGLLPPALSGLRFLGTIGALPVAAPPLLSLRVTRLRPGAVPEPRAPLLEQTLCLGPLPRQTSACRVRQA